MKKSFPIVLALIFFSFFCFAEDPNKTLSPYFFVEGDPAVDQLPLKDTRVDIAIAGVIADVKVAQTYGNEGTRPINARYIFPLSTRAAVYGMRMIIGDQVIVAKIKERERAKQEFEEAKQKGKSASLLEQNRPNVFSMSVSNIIPGEQVEIQLQYTELLIPTDGVYELVFPTVVGPRYSSQPEPTATAEDQWVKSPYLHEGESARAGFYLNSRISTAVPIQDLLCPSHSIIPQWKSPSTAELVLDESQGSQGNRDFILRYRLAGEEIATGLMLYRGNHENFFLYMAQPPKRVRDADIPVREYVFVVDISGSMHGFPLDVSKQLLRDLMGRLKPSDLFNVVLFAGSSQILSPSSLPAFTENVDHAVRLIDSQYGGGGTELLSAIQRATSIPLAEGISRTIVLVTDGYIEAEKQVFQYIRDHLHEANVFAFGIGSSVNRYLIEGVAKAGNGEPFVVTHPDEAAAIATKFRQYIQTPAMTDVRITWRGFDAYDVEPANVPDLFAQRPVILFGKWRGPVTGSFHLEGQTGRGHYQTDLEIDGVETAESNRALRYLWARSRIAELSDYSSHLPDAERVNEITSLGLTYNLLTRYTSFIAVREVVTNTQGPAKDVNQPLPLPKGVSDLAVGGGNVAAGNEPELFWMVLLAAAFFTFARLRYRTKATMSR